MLYRNAVGAINLKDKRGSSGGGMSLDLQRQKPKDRKSKTIEALWKK